MSGTENTEQHESIFARAEVALLRCEPERIQENGLFILHDGIEMTLSTPAPDGYITLVNMDPTAHPAGDYAIDALSDFIAMSIPQENVEEVDKTSRTMVFRLKDELPETSHEFSKGAEELALTEAHRMLRAAWVISERRSSADGKKVGAITAQISSLRKERFPYLWERR